MKIVRSIGSLILGVLLVSLISEATEYLIITTILNVDANPANPGPYFEARNQPSILVLKHVYTIIAGYIASYLALKVANRKPLWHASGISILQVAGIVIGLTDPSIARSLSPELWISITLAAVIGIMAPAVQIYRNNRSTTQT